jgi:hypothetical protein
MAYKPTMAKKTHNANMAYKPIMPKKENMARIPSLSSGTMISSIADTTNTVITPTSANTPNKANMARIPKGFPLRLPRPWYNYHDYRRPHYKTKPRHKQTSEKILAVATQDHEQAERDQYRTVRALAWWQAWDLLHAARQEVEICTARQTESPDVWNTACLQAA